MNKKELAAIVAKQTGVSEAEAGKVLSTALDAIADAIKKGDKVTLTGFGTFEIQEKRPVRAGSKSPSAASVAGYTTAGERAVFSPGAKLRATGQPKTSNMDEQWDKSFAASTKTLDELSERALAQHRAGRTRPLDPDKL